MTRQDIDDIINVICPNDADFEKAIISPAYLKKELEALALEQESCEDCINREEVKKFVEYIQAIKDSHNEKGSPINYGTICDIAILGYRLLDLPPVTPTTCIAKISFDKEAFQKIVDEKVQELVAHGTCKDCSIKRLDKEESEEVGAEKYFCPVVCGFVDETPDFYCEKFENGGN